MSLGDWMVAVMTLVAAVFIVWLELHCRRSHRQNERERARAQDTAVEPVKRIPAE